MTQKHKIQLFEDQKIRTAWYEEKEEWLFSIVDVCWVLIEQSTTRGVSNYWAVLKKRLLEEGSDELLTKCKRLKIRATDGKMRLTDVSDTEQLFRCRLQKKTSSNCRRRMENTRDKIERRSYAREFLDMLPILAMLDNPDAYNRLHGMIISDPW